MPLFFQDAGAKENSLVQFVEKVMDDSGLVFKQKDAGQIHAAKLATTAVKTLSAQQVLAMLADESEDAKRPVTPTGCRCLSFRPTRAWCSTNAICSRCRRRTDRASWEMLKRVAATIAAIDRRYDPQADVDALARQFTR
jgi:uncharacterized paraquat-inducible protein A